jgi:acetoacetyl-CoA reductase
MEKFKVVIYGGTGGLGTQVSKFLETRYDVKIMGSKDMDFSNPELYNGTAIPDADIVIYMAGYNHDGFIHKQPLEEVQKQINVNLLGAYHVMQRYIPIMKAKKFGRFIIMSSVLAEHPIMGTSAYSMTKAALDNLVKTCALETAKFGISCSSIQLGYFDGGLTHKVPKDVMEKVLATIPVGRLGLIDELYNAIIFLIQNPYATGTNLSLTGGL